MEPAPEQATAEDTEKVSEFAAERIGDLRGDAVLLMARPDSERAVMEAMPIWSTVADRALWLNQAQGEAINNGGVLAKTWLPGSLEPELARITG